ncbi:MAG: D-alanyl-D-alanine carboxypeptidase [Chthoniobacterales bacterium]|nr:D-alanyl-D-alanine carboxypeptidase [Chthoniobacterales bacterium]
MKFFLLPVLLAASTFCSVRAAESFIIADAQTGFILGSRNRDEKLPVASLTKIANAVVVLDWAKLKQADLSQLVEVSPSALQAGGANPVGLQAGDSLSLRDLLYCMLLASDNVAATSLSEVVGSRLPNASGLNASGNFVSHMNALARSLGMTRTLFLNASGFDGGESKTFPYSTAEDMARLTRYAYNVQGFPFYVAQAARQIHVFRNGAEMTFDIQNTNELLGRNGIDGVKTGRTRRAGDCLILSADRMPESRREGETVYVTPRRIILVMLRSPDRFTEGFSLMEKGWNLYDAWAAKGRKTSKSDSL